MTRFEEAQRAHPVVDTRKVRELLDTSFPSAQRAIDALVSAGVLRPQGTRRRDRVWVSIDWQAW